LIRLAREDISGRASSQTFDSHLKSDPARLKALQEDKEDFLPRGAHPVGTVRVDVSYERQLLHSATCWEGTELKFPVTVDEPPSRGGDGAAPAPLSYFVLGAAACLLTQLAKLAMLDELKINSMSMSARGHFNRKLGGTFSELVFDVKISGAEKSARVKRLSRDAEGQCYASNTLKKAVKLVTNIEYNGGLLLTLSSTP